MSREAENSDASTLFPAGYSARNPKTPASPIRAAAGDLVLVLVCGGASANLDRVRGPSLDPERYLHDNNSTEFFEKLGDLLVPGPTLANVNDFRAVLVDSP